MTATILIVEDESIVAQDIQMTLEELGYQVVAIADSGELAIQVAINLQPNLILMDIRLLGEMDGIEAAFFITEQVNIPIVYLTAHGDEETLARAKLTTPFGYLIKPFSERELRITIEIALYKYEIQQKLVNNEQWLTTILHSVGDGVITTDINQQITYLNPVAEQLTGWTFVEAIGQPIADVLKIVNETTRQSVANPVAKAIKTGEITSLDPNTLLIRQDGQEIPIGDSAAPINNHKGTIPLKDTRNNCIGAVLIFRDITEHKIVTQRLHRQAFYDSLTNLPNRVWFMERLIDALERVKRNPNYLFAVFFLDLDRFKVINESLGHQVGDYLLTAVAERFKQVVRTLDTVARFGGDEFAIILEHLQSPEEAIQVAQRLSQSIRVPFYIAGQEIFTNTSIGVVLSSLSYESVEDVVRDADIAMYRAKAKGRGCYEVFDPAIGEQVISVSRLEHDLRGAIERNELVVYYQPIVDLRTEKITGVEALVRWQHPQQNLLLPAHFIPIAEETGLISNIDRWVLQEAARQMKAWLSLNQQISLKKVSVNLSSDFCFHPNLKQEIAKILQDIGLPPGHLTLEITETALIRNPEAATAILKQLKDLGIRLSLDDFGTGYSSLSYLHRFPVDILKIDRSFIANLNKATESIEIVKAIINLGQTLNLDVVAEGIETCEQLELLQQHQCHYGQGYWFSPPLSVSQITPLLVSRGQSV